jgi:hypothetical protein
MWVALDTIAAFTCRARWCLSGTFNCAQASTASGLAGWPGAACTPADDTSIFGRFLTASRKSASAIGLRQLLPVHTKRTWFAAGSLISEDRDGEPYSVGAFKSTRPAAALPQVAPLLSDSFWIFHPGLISDADHRIFLR